MSKYAFVDDGYSAAALSRPQYRTCDCAWLLYAASISSHVPNRPENLHGAKSPSCAGLASSPGDVTSTWGSGFTHSTVYGHSTSHPKFAALVSLVLTTRKSRYSAVGAAEEDEEVDGRAGGGGDIADDAPIPTQPVASPDVHPPMSPIQHCGPATVESAAKMSSVSAG